MSEAVVESKTMEVAPTEEGATSNAPRFEIKVCSIQF